MIDSALRRSLLTAMALGFAASAIAQPAGLLTLTDSHGVPAPGAIFSSLEDVYFTAGPIPSGPLAPDCTDGALPDGEYVFQVTDNSGKSLLSSDAASNRVFTVAGGVLVSTSGSHAISTDVTACGGSWLAVSPFSRAAGGQGVYKLWVAASADVLGCAEGAPCGFTSDNSIRVNFVVREDIRCLETHCLSGSVFEDSNGDGIRASSEPAQADVTVEAIDASGLSVDTVSGRDGMFSMCGLPETSYRVIEIVPSGYRQTAPAGKRQISRYLFVRDFGYDLQFCNSDLANLNFGNFPLPGSIAGTKFSDPNGNGVRDPGEPGLPGVTIALADSQGHVVGSQTTDASGAYRFDNLVHGSYTLSETVPPGYRQTAPGGSGTLSVNLAAGEAATGSDFGNQQLGAIAGIKFDDANGNGVQDPGEEGLGGVQIVLAGGGGATQSVKTGADGSFSFTNLVPGTFTLSEVVPAGYRQTTPGGSGELPVTVEAGQTASGSSFGNQKLGRITGRKFSDVNGNGVRDSGEAGLSGVTITLLAPDGSTQTAITAADGTFAFGNLVPGSYVLSEEVPHGYRQTRPGGNGMISVTVSAGRESAGNLFGNQQVGSIAGIKFEDLNGNGVADPGEGSLSGVTITLTGPDGSTQTAVSDFDGQFGFANLPPGTYSLSEAVPAGYYQTFPGGSGTLAITVTGGQVSTASFGNRLLGAISGMKFNDVNGNGLLDSGETGLAGVTIVEKASDGTTRSTTTGQDGSFSFTGVIPGDVTVSEVVPSGFSQTAPGGDGEIAVTVVSGMTASGLLFGNHLLAPGSISGTKFQDSNGNGSRDAGEPALSGVTIGLRAPDGSTLSTVTAADGSFSFSGLAPGAYTISETVPDGFQQTAPGGAGTISVTVSAGKNSGGNLFGNQPLPGSIAGFIFEDENKNQKQDGSEGPLGGVTVQLFDAADQIVATTVTASDGTFLFSNVAPGNYTVHPVPPSGFFQTLPNLGKPIPVDLAPGASVTGLVFGLTC